MQTATITEINKNMLFIHEAYIHQVRKIRMKKLITMGLTLIASSVWAESKAL